MVSSVTAFEDMGPSPRVDVFVDAADLQPSTTSLTVWQISESGSFPVRGATRQTSAGGFTVTDFEPPVGRPVSYKVQEFNAGGSEVTFAITLNTQVNGIPDGWAVIQDPLAPSNAVLVQAAEGFAETLKKSRPSKVYRAGDSTLALLGEQGLLEDVPLRFWTTTPDDMRVFRAIVDQGQFLVRCAPNLPVPAVFHVVAPAPVRRPLDYHEGGTWDEWSLQADQVSRSELNVLVPVVTYAQFNAFFATYTAFNAAYSTYLTAIRNPPGD